MNHSIYALTLNAMQNDVQKLEKIGTNLNNTQTAGFKRQIAFSEVFQKNLEHATINPVVSVNVRKDFSQGVIKTTNQKLDFAINGEGFFSVKTPKGEAYTRNGSFIRTVEGNLVTLEGYPVLSNLGAEIKLSQLAESMSADGANLTVGELDSDGIKDQFKIIRFDQNSTHEIDANGYLHLSDHSQVLEANKKNYTIEQGKLESSNVQSAHEMLQLMQVMRHFESMQKVTQHYDELLGMAIKKFGEVN